MDQLAGYTIAVAIIWIILGLTGFGLYLILYGVGTIALIWLLSRI